MAKQIKRRRGTTVDHTTTSGGFIGADGEITVDTDKYTLVVHDDTTIGGWPVLREDLSNVDVGILNSFIDVDLIGAATAAQGALAESNEIQLGILNTQIIALASLDSILDPTDTPSTFGTVGQVLIVNLATNALEFSDIATTFQELSDTATFGPPDANKILKVSVDGEGIDLGIVLPIFGTAASEDIDFFAIGAEGDLAVTALQTASLGTSFFITEAMLDGALTDKINDSFQNELSGVAAPTQNDDLTQGFSVGSFWIDINADEAYRAVDVSPGAAVWIRTTLQTTDLGTSATVDTGTSVGNVVIVQGTGKIDPSLLPATVLLDITNESILDLSDTPATYTGQANKLLRVNPGATAVEFIDQPSTTKIEDSSGKTFVDTALNANIVDVWAADGEGVSRPVAAFIANSLAILGEKLTFSNDTAKSTIAATNISGTTPVDLVLKPQSTGDIFFDGAVKIGAPGTISTIDDNSLTISSGDGISSNAGHLILRGGDGTSTFISGDVDIQGGTGGAAPGNVIINGITYPTTDGSDGDILITDGFGNLSFATSVTAITSFQDLTDADDYAGGDADKVVKVNGSGTGIEFGIVLGTAAGSNIGDFATAAQGTLADSAVQPGDVTSITESMLTVAVQNKLNDSILNKLDATVDPTNNEDSGDGYEVGSLWINVSTDAAFINVDSTVASAIWDQINIGIVNIVEDTTPQLGGTLDTNGNNITMTGAETVDGRDLSVDGAKLDLIEANATADQTASEILTLIKTVDGTGSGLDADLLDGNEGTVFAKKADNNTYTKAQRGAPVAIASSATITPDFDAGNNFEIDTIAINFILANPTNMTNAAGQSGAIVIVQDGTGSRLLSSVGSFWKTSGGGLPVLSTAAGSVDTLVYYVRSSTFIVVDVILDAQ